MFESVQLHGHVKMHGFSVKSAPLKCFGGVSLHHFYSRQNVGKMMNSSCLVGFLGSLSQNAK